MKPVSDGPPVLKDLNSSSWQVEAVKYVARQVLIQDYLTDGLLWPVYRTVDECVDMAYELEQAET